MKATITPHGVKGENGKNYDVLGSGQSYGFDSAYAVRESGEIAAPPVPAHTLPWPWGGCEIELHEIL